MLKSDIVNCIFFMENHKKLSLSFYVYVVWLASIFKLTKNWICKCLYYYFRTTLVRNQPVSNCHFSGLVTVDKTAKSDHLRYQTVSQHFFGLVQLPLMGPFWVVWQNFTHNIWPCHLPTYSYQFRIYGDSCPFDF